MPHPTDADPPDFDSAGARFRALVEHSQDVVNMFDANLRLLYTSPSMERVLGWRPEELVGVDPLTLVHPDDLDSVTATLGGVTGAPGRMIPFRFRAHRRDGGWSLVEGAGINLLHDSAVRAIVSSFRDVTERARIEERLREGEERYRTLFENAPVGIGLAARDGTLIEFNDAMLKPGGYTREDVLAIGNVARLYADPAARSEVLARFAREGSVRHVEVQFLRKDGTPYDALLSLTPVITASEPRVLAIVEDISARRALEARLIQSQKMEAVGQLAGGVAHDFNNLLTAIRGYADLCATTLPPGHPALECVTQILAASDRATVVTRRLLAFARRERVEPRLVDVHALIGGIEPLLRQMVGERVLLEIHLDEPPSIVRIDPALFEQVVVNLAVNARDAMPAGGRLRIGTSRPSAALLESAGLAGDWAAIEVRDDGVGMTPQVRAHAFEPFFTTKGPDRGTGLGLATCYGLVRQAGGHIDLQSVPGEGTTVRILLPLSRGERAAEPAGSGAADGPWPAVERSAGETVLLVEDESGVREFTRTALLRLGYRVIEASDGREGLAVAGAHGGSIDVVLSDVVMPHMTGPEMAAALRRGRPGLPVVFMSGYADPSVRGTDIDAAGAELLLKPFSVDALSRRLRAAIATR